MDVAARGKGQGIGRLKHLTVSDPYRIETPALVSFSGGRTSGYMLWHILQAFDGHLPDDVHVVFFNTGREFEATLRFVHECATRWGVKITWLEYDMDAKSKTAVVDYNSASRNGEPFSQVIASKKMLPNPVTRFCTSELKVKRGIAYMRDFCGYKAWTNTVGLRRDEPRRVAKMRARNDAATERFESVAPLYDSHVTVRDVASFWKAQEFDLALPGVNGKTPLGNCDLCFLKGTSTIVGIIRMFPETAQWWIDAETNAPGTGTMLKNERALFRKDRPSYANLLIQAQDQLEFDDTEESLPCGCHD